MPGSAVVEFVNVPGGAWLARLESLVIGAYCAQGVAARLRHRDEPGAPAHLQMADERLAVTDIAACDERELGEWLRLRAARAAGRSTVLFVCTGNAVRSQMAEGLVNHFYGLRWSAFSAGTMPMGLARDTVAVMAEFGIDLNGHFAKSVDLFRNCRFDRVAVLCSDAGTRCPVFEYAGEVDALPFDDPMAPDALSGAIRFGFKSDLRALFKRMKRQLADYLGPPE